MAKSRRSLCLFKQLHSISMNEEKQKYLNKQQELVDILTNEMTEQYRAQETMETKLDGILAIISNESEDVEESSRYLRACPRKDEFDALSESMKLWTTKVKNVSHGFEEFLENDNLIIEVKDNLLEKL